MTDQSIKITPIVVSVHRSDVNPVFGEQAIHVKVDDEAGGPFIILTSNGDNDAGEIRIDMDELEAVTKAARQLIHGYEKAAKKVAV